MNRDFINIVCKKVGLKPKRFIFKKDENFYMLYDNIKKEKLWCWYSITDSNKVNSMWMIQDLLLNKYIKLNCIIIKKG